MTLLYSPLPSRAAAKKIARHLLKKRLICCANIFPIESMYWWNGKIASEKEVVLLAKTTGALLLKAKKELEAMHPYDVPCVLTMRAGVNAAYERWMERETSIFTIHDTRNTIHD